MAGGNRSKPDEFTLGDSGQVDNPGSVVSADAAGNSDSVGENPSVVDPADARQQSSDGPEYTGGTNKDGSPTKKRGRRKGSEKPQRQNDPSDLGAIQALLISIHSIVALKVPEMRLEEQEAALLAQSIARVERHYPMIAGVITGKIADHLALGTTLATIYGTRFAAIKIRKAAENATPVNQGTAAVYNFNRPAE